MQLCPGSGSAALVLPVSLWDEYMNRVRPSGGSLELGLRISKRVLGRQGKRKELVWGLATRIYDLVLSRDTEAVTARLPRPLLQWTPVTYLDLVAQRLLPGNNPWPQASGSGLCASGTV